jgi:hypothetical protein
VKKILLFLFIIVTHTSLSRQFVFKRNYNSGDPDYGYSAVQAYDGNYVIAGHTLGRIRNPMMRCL